MSVAAQAHDELAASDDPVRIVSHAGAAYATLARERLAQRMNETVTLQFTGLQLRAALTALEWHAQRSTHLDPALRSLRDALQIALNRTRL